MTMGIGKPNLYDKITSGTLTRTDYVRAKMARSLNKHNKIETEALKVRKRLELENELKDNLASVAESYANVQSLCEGFKTAKSSDETTVKFLDGDVNVAKDLTIQVTALAQKTRAFLSSAELDNMQGLANGQLALDSSININNRDYLFRINNVTIRNSRPNGVYTMENLIADVNSHTAETGVVAYFNQVLGQMVLEQDREVNYTRENDAMLIEWDNTLSNKAYDNKNESIQRATINVTSNEQVVPNNAYQLDGNILTIAGARFQLLKVDNTPCSFQIANGDADKVANGVENFVNQLNTFLRKINKLYNEEPDQKAELPTVEERESMTEEEMTKREEKVCKGIFYHNHELRELAVNAGDIIKDMSSNMPGIDIWSTAIGLRGTNEDGRLVSIQLNKTKLATALTNGTSQGGFTMSTDEVLKMLSGAKTDEYSGGFLTRFAALCAEQRDSYTQLDIRGVGTARKHTEAQQKLQDSLAAIEREEKRIMKQYNDRQTKIEKMETQMFYLTSSWDAIMGAQYN